MSKTINNKRASSNSFEELGLSDWLVKQCKVVGIKRPTTVQTNLIPEILKGKNCIGCDKTGSGKTAAFALPILQSLAEDPRATCALILTPTRELAYQIQTHFSVLGQPLHLMCIVVTGGMDHVQQGIDLTNSPHIIIATPGRLADHIRMETKMNLNMIQFLVLDEADRLLEQGYREDLKLIYSQLPQKRQTLFFSATFTETLAEVAKVSVNKPYVWTSKSDVATVETLDERYIFVPPDMKNPYLVYIVNSYAEMHKNSLVLIFVPTCKLCQILGLAFLEVGIECATMHSEISQKLRLSALTKFKSNQVKILLATDVGSRGLDIPQVDLVINYNVPWETKTYIHRVGRTARAGRGGMAITLVTAFDVCHKNRLVAIEDAIGKQLTKYEVDERSVAKIAVEVMAAVNDAKTRLEEEDFGERREINKKKRLILEAEDVKTERKRKKSSSDKEVRNKGTKKMKEVKGKATEEDKIA